MFQLKNYNPKINIKPFVAHGVQKNNKKTENELRNYLNRQIMDGKKELKGGKDVFSNLLQ